MTRDASYSRGADFADAADAPSARRSESDVRRSTSLISWHSFNTLWRALTIRDDDKLTAEESASTLFRFFRSKHVLDLKLIFALAVVILIIHAAIALLLSNPDLFHLPAGFRGQLSGNDAGSLNTYLGPAVPVYGAILGWAYLSAATRLGVVDLFACEIRTVCRVGTAFDIGQHYVALYRNGPPPGQPTPSADSESKEEYFSIFANNSGDLQPLEAGVVGHITEFYTYMKATRDLQRKFATIQLPSPSDPSQTAAAKNATPLPEGMTIVPQPDVWHGTLANLIYVMYLGYEGARKAMEDLIEFEPTKAEGILVTELACYPFLCEYLKDDDLRFKRLQLREGEYRKIMKRLDAKVNATHIDREYWTPAERTFKEVEDRYHAAMKTLAICAKYRQQKSVKS